MLWRQHCLGHPSGGVEGGKAPIRIAAQQCGKDSQHVALVQRRPLLLGQHHRLIHSQLHHFGALLPLHLHSHTEAGQDGARVGENGQQEAAWQSSASEAAHLLVASKGREVTTAERFVLQAA